VVMDLALVEGAIAIMDTPATIALLLMLPLLQEATNLEALLRTSGNFINILFQARVLQMNSLLP